MHLDAPYDDKTSQLTCVSRKSGSLLRGDCLLLPGVAYCCLALPHIAYLVVTRFQREFFRIRLHLCP